MSVVSMKQLLEAGVHFGHQTSRWNPKMKKYIYGERNGIHVIDLEKTVDIIENQVYPFVVEQAKQVLNNNGLLIFEIGYDELEQMKELLSKNKEYTMLESLKDYGGNDRVVVCRFQQM